MGRLRRRKCRNCRELFIPDHRNQNKQRYCSKPQCKKASKSASQKKWLAQEDNKNYFRGPEHVQRVQRWRTRNPGYWKRGTIKQEALPDDLFRNTESKQKDSAKLTKPPLQDLLTDYPVVLVGLLAHLSGSLLQDDIAHTGLRLQQLGFDILKEPSPNSGGRHDSTPTTHPRSLDPPGSGAVQLDRSAVGP